MNITACFDSTSTFIEFLNTISPDNVYALFRAAKIFTNEEILEKDFIRIKALAFTKIGVFYLKEYSSVKQFNLDIKNLDALDPIIVKDIDVSNGSIEILQHALPIAQA